VKKIKPKSVIDHKPIAELILYKNLEVNIVPLNKELQFDFLPMACKLNLLTKLLFMKVKLISLVVTLFIFSASYSQLNLGIKGGASINKITGQSFKDQFTFGYHLGAYATIGLGGKLSVQPEVLFNQFKVDTATNFSSVYHFNNVKGVKLNYLTIPILLNYNFGKVLALQAGPQFGVLMDKSKNLLQNGQQAFKSGDFSMVGGVQLKLLNFRVYGRYVVGLSDLSNITSSDKWKSQSIQLGVGIGI
jgi:hypothetical protein